MNVHIAFHGTNVYELATQIENLFISIGNDGEEYEKSFRCVSIHKVLPIAKQLVASVKSQPELIKQAPIKNLVKCLEEQFSSRRQHRSDEIKATALQLAEMVFAPLPKTKDESDLPF